MGGAGHYTGFVMAACPPAPEQNNCFEKIMIGSHELMKKKRINDHDRSLKTKGLDRQSKWPVDGNDSGDPDDDCEAIDVIAE